MCSLKLEPADLPQFTRLFLLDETESTNLLGQQYLTQPDALARKSLGVLSVIATGHQTKGKGRMDRVWSAPAGTSLSTSYLVRPHANPSLRFPLESYHWITLLLALAAVRALEESAPVQVNLKWPNDVLVGDKKICGILAQLVVEPDNKYSLVAGIGTNVNLAKADLPVDTATSLLCETGKEYELGQILQLLSQNFVQLLHDFFAVGGDPEAPLGKSTSLLEQIKNRMGTLGQEVKVHLPDGNIREGRAIDLNKEGEILIQEVGGAVQPYAVGDIVHLRPRK